MKNAYRKSGFTLVEILIAVLLLGVAIASLMASNIAFTQANGIGCELSTAEFLIEQMREKTALISFDNLTAANCQTAKTQSLAGLAGYNLDAVVENVSDFGPSTDFKKVTVTVSLNGKTINSGSWIRAKY